MASEVARRGRWLGSRPAERRVVTVSGAGVHDWRLEWDGQTSSKSMLRRASSCKTSMLCALAVSNGGAASCHGAAMSCDSVIRQPNSWPPRSSRGSSCRNAAAAEVASTHWKRRGSAPSGIGAALARAQLWQPPHGAGHCACPRAASRRWRMQPRVARWRQRASVSASPETLSASLGPQNRARPTSRPASHSCETTARSPPSRAPRPLRCQKSNTLPPRSAWMMRWTRARPAPWLHASVVKRTACGSDSKR